jgi:DNA-binding NarL/FixJ family response regulator
VKTHFEHIYAKLEVSDRVAAVAKAVRSGLVE